MLTKLLKYEFKATARVYGGLYLALVAVACLLGFSVHRRDVEELLVDDRFLDGMVFLYGALALALVVVTVVTVIQRFTRNLLGREGYLMHTLPVTEAQLVASKLISSAVWLLCSGLVGVVSLLLMMLLSVDLSTMDLSGFWKDLVALQSGFEGKILAIAAGMLLLCYARTLCTILCVYAACMVGHQVTAHSGIVSVAAFFLMSWVQSWLENLLQTGGLLRILMGPDGSGAMSTGDFFLSSFAVTAAFGVAYFALTTLLMKKRLNLN